MVSDITSRNSAGKTWQRRASFGPSPVGVLLPVVTKAAFQKHAPTSAALMMDWPLVVGPNLASTTFPRRFVSGTLTLGCAGPVALELQHLATTLMERINQYLGHTAVTRLRFVQEAALPVASVAKRLPRPQPILVEGLAESPLRNALASLGASVARDPT